MVKKFLLILVTAAQLLLSQTLNRQMKVETFEEDQTGVINPERDKALIIVRSQIPDLVFDANRNIEVKPQSGSVWYIYCLPGTIRLKISAKGFEQLEIPPKNVIGGKTFNLRLLALGFSPNVSEDLFEIIFSINQPEVYVSYGTYSPVLSRSQTISYKLPKGKYTFTFQKNGFNDFKQTVTLDKNLQIPVTLQEGSTQNKKFALPGLIIIDSQPNGAEVLIDGQKIGVTPFQGDLTAGTHQLEVRKTMYYPSITSFTLKEGESQSIPVTLKSKFGYIQFSGIPAGAKVSLDGKVLEQIPVGKQQIESGKHTIKIELELYHSYTEQFQISDGEEKTVNVKLTPAFGSLKINSLPENGAAVFLDGKEAGTTPYSNTQLASGKYIIKLSKPFYADVEEEVIIEDEKNTEKNIVMPQNFGTLTISAPESRIFINGKSAGSDKFTSRMIPAKYSLRAERGEKYISAEKDVSISSGGSELVELKPEPRLGSISVLVDPPTARDAEIFVDNKSFGNAPKVLTLLIGNYTVTTRKSGYLDLSQQITVKEREAAKINMRMFTYEGSLQERRDSWGTYKWISGIAAVGAGAAAYYFNTTADSYHKKYLNAQSFAAAKLQRSNVEKSKLYNNISLGTAAAAGAMFLASWVVQISI